MNPYRGINGYRYRENDESPIVGAQPPLAAPHRSSVGWRCGGCDRHLIVDYNGGAACGFVGSCYQADVYMPRELFVA